MFRIVVIILCLYINLQRHSIAFKVDAIDKLSKTGYIDGDFVIGTMFPVHGSLLSIDDKNDPLKCDIMRHKLGIQLVEAAFYTIDSINKDENILPGIKLGISIKDDCWSEHVALYQAIKFVEKPYSAKSSSSESSGYNSPVLIGMVGATTSTSTNQVQSLLKLYKIPQIGYSTSLLDLKPPHFFLSVVPNHYHETYVTLAVINAYKWNYISVAYTEGYYSGSEKYLFQEWSKYIDVCIAANIRMPKPNQGMLYVYALSELFKDPRARVIVCFCDGPTVNALFKEIHNRNLTGSYTIVINSDWHINHETIRGYEKEAQGSIIIEKRKYSVPEFDEYFLGLNVQNNKRNPWFEEFWQFQFQCSINQDNSTLPPCTGKEDLSKNYLQSPSVSYVIKAIYAFALGLHKMRADTCKNEVGPCPELYPFNTTAYMDYLSNLDFTFHGENVNFAFNGTSDVARYDIINYQKLRNANSYDFVKVGDYFFEFRRNLTQKNYNNQHMILPNVQYPGLRSTPIISSCSDDCPVGHRQLRGNGKTDKLCCWSCVPCEQKQILVSESTCQNCSQGYWPNEDKTQCIRLPIVYSRWVNRHLVIAQALSSFGIVLTILTTCIFVKYRETPVVKSSSRELCYLILFGTFMLHCTSFIAFLQPSFFSCVVIETLPSISCTFVYVPLFVKTNRIARLLAISKKKFPNLHPKFMSLKAQLIISFTLIAIIVISGFVYTIQTPPYVRESYDKDTEDHCFINVECVFSGNIFRFCMVYKVILIILATYYAVKTRNIPDNFNEMKYIGFLMYIICLTSLGYYLVYYGSGLKTFATSIHTSANAFAVLVILFFPKLYIILRMPEKNTRENFTTTPGIRFSVGHPNVLPKVPATSKKTAKSDVVSIEELSHKPIFV